VSPTLEDRQRRRLRWLDYVRVTLICFAFGVIVVAGTYYYVQRTSDRLDNARQRSDRQFKKAQILANNKFQQTLILTTKQANYANNRRACGWRKFVGPIVASYVSAANDKTQSKSSRDRNAERVKTTEAFLDSQVTIPPDFDCSSLPKKPPKKP
jgi:hypothetical protein